MEAIDLVISLCVLQDEMPSVSWTLTDVADWSGRAVEAEEMSRHAANAAEMSSRVIAAWENVSRAGDDSYRRMHAIVHSQMDQISGWARL